jgi:hypothetical protein
MFIAKFGAKKGRIMSCQYSHVNWGGRLESRGVNEHWNGRCLSVPLARTTWHGLSLVKPSNFLVGTYIFRDSSRRTESLHFQIASETHPRKTHRFTSTIVHHPRLHLHLIAMAIAIVCNWDLLMIGDLVRIFGIDLSNSTIFFSLILLLWVNSPHWLRVDQWLASHRLCASNYMRILFGDS